MSHPCSIRGRNSPRRLCFRVFPVFRGFSHFSVPLFFLSKSRQMPFKTAAINRSAAHPTRRSRHLSTFPESRYTRKRSLQTTHIPYARQCQEIFTMSNLLEKRFVTSLGNRKPTSPWMIPSIVLAVAISAGKLQRLRRQFVRPVGGQAGLQLRQSDLRLGLLAEQGRGAARGCSDAGGRFGGLPGALEGQWLADALQKELESLRAILGK